MNTWWKIRLQLNSNLESNQIWTLRSLHLIIQLVQNLKSNGTHDAKLRIQYKFNWIFLTINIYIYIYIFIYMIQDLNSLVFAPNNLLATKIKKLDVTYGAKLNSN